MIRDPRIRHATAAEEFNPAGLRARLLAWYEQHGRSVPWRHSHDPYAIWVAATMLQQTRVAAVVPYYERWLAHFPTISSLAAASTDQVLQLWQGLGYYRRAHQLHRTARLVVDKYGGQLPDTAAELERLPGIGPYTAAAIAAIAFQRPVAAIDGNLRRTLARLAAVPGDPTMPPAAEEIRRLAESLVARQPGRVNQALMDLGAMVCLPRQPRCAVCPLADACRGRLLGKVHHLPESGARPAPRAASCFAFRLEHGGAQLVARRPDDGLLPGLWEFPLVAAGQHGDAATALREALGLTSAELAAGRSFVHLFSHVRLTVHPYHGRLASRASPSGGAYVEFRWATEAELDELPGSALMRRLRSDTRPG